MQEQSVYDRAKEQKRDDDNNNNILERLEKRRSETRKHPPSCQDKYTDTCASTRDFVERKQESKQTRTRIDGGM
jgi:hypothetical protein